MSSSAITTQVAQLKIGNVQNQADSSSVYSNGIWSFKNSTALTSVTITDAGNVGIGTASPYTFGTYKSLDIRGAGGGWLNMGTTGTSSFYIFTDGTNSGIVTQTNGYLGFSTNNTERMRIDASGNLLVGTTSAPSSGRMRVTIPSASAQIQLERTTTSPGSGLIGADGNNCFNVYDSSINPRFYVTQAGNYWFSGTNVSDERLKEDIQDAESQLQNVLALAPKTFRFKAQVQEDGNMGEPGRIQHGFIAQEVKAILPKLVTGAETNPDEYMGVDYMGLTSVLVKAIQELSAKVDAQAEEIKALKAQP